MPWDVLKMLCTQQLSYGITGTDPGKSAGSGKTGLPLRLSLLVILFPNNSVFLPCGLGFQTHPH